MKLLKLFVVLPFSFLVIFIPGLIIGALVLLAWALSLALFSAGVGMLLFLPEVIRLTETLWAISAVIFGSIGCMGLGALSGLLMFLVTRAVLLMMISYIQWSIKFVSDP